MTTPHPTFTPQQQRNRRVNKIILTVVGGIAGLVVLLVIIGALVGEAPAEEDQAAANTPTATVEPEPVAASTAPETPAASTAKPKATPVQKMRAAVKKIAPEAKIDPDKGLTTIVFPISDNFSKGLISTGAQTDTIKLLEAVHESGYATDSVEIDGTFETVDDYGNSNQSKVVRVMYSAAVLGKINYDNVNHEKIWDLADELSFVHPDLR